MKRIHLTSLLAAIAATAAGLVMVTMAAQSSHAQVHAGGQRRVATDGNGNVNAVAGSGFNTAAGGQGLRTRSFQRDADGNASARSQTSVTGANGKSFDGSTTYTKGSGFSRSASCKDAAGNSVSCAPR